MKYMSTTLKPNILFKDVIDAILVSPTFKAATIIQKSDELESTSAQLSLITCCKSAPEM